MFEDEAANLHSRNEKLHANIKKLIKERNVDDLAFLNSLNENNKPESTIPPSFTRHKTEFQSNLESINKMGPPSKRELERRKENTEESKRNDIGTSFPKEISPKKTSVVQEENKKLKMEIAKLNKNINSLKRSVEAKDQERKELIEDYKDKERRIFKDQDSNQARLRREYDHKIQNLQAKIDEKNENEVKLSQKYDRLREESLIKDSIIQKLNDEIVKKDKDYKKMIEEITLESQRCNANIQPKKSEEEDEEIYHAQDVGISNDQDHLNIKSRLEALDRRFESRFKQELAKNENEIINDDVAYFSQTKSTKFAQTRPTSIPDSA
ncbi:hypothetical protein CORT_0E03770 [Candida orthopsilosis Co 90-125]|uniref:Uncharacterized protein n=1 Tax=Candida orthopsilosis (strain 90-125) TaxID=1136231 RepID=H8X737_CANO9|nr:hypothetical protein CORT_0E03770 [Candida orthopsilosis Co 90-125]CCG23965.1 hypothetical protein CORT_0E03770 [Candida orthopsilosis Co 90-125]